MAKAPVPKSVSKPASKKPMATKVPASKQKGPSSIDGAFLPSGKRKPFRGM
jgi:hypothetical protein